MLTSASNPRSIESISNAIEVLDWLKKSRLAMMPALRENRPIETVRLAERELKALDYIQESIGDIRYVSLYQLLAKAIDKAIETEANHLNVNIHLGDSIDYSKSNFLQIKFTR